VITLCLKRALEKIQVNKKNLQKVKSSFCIPALPGKMEAVYYKVMLAGSMLRNTRNCFLN